jgi:hypothetical protein
MVAAPALPAAAFTFADGTTGVCTARGEVVVEVIAARDDPVMQQRTGLTARVGGGWQITWNGQRLQSLPPELHDFIFFHECAHARVPTEVELEANCAGLIDMRAAGRAGFAFETRLRKQVGRASYWTDTFQCADEYAARERAPKPAEK